MASPPKLWKAEYAKSAHSDCKTCKHPIDQEKLRASGSPKWSKPSNSTVSSTADQLMFGALSKCIACSTSHHLSGGIYRCVGYLSARNKCSYSTGEPKQLKEREVEIPDETNSKYLIKDEWRHNTNAAGGVPRSRKAIDEGDNKVTVKVKGQSAVLEASGLQDAGHILEDGGLI